MKAIIIDSNEKDKKRIDRVKEYCYRNDILFTRQRLDVGDYMLAEVDSNGIFVPINNISVDTKKNILELAKNLFSQNDNKRFIRELCRAKKNGIKLIILIENDVLEDYTIDTLSKWKSPCNYYNEPYTKLKGYEIANKIRYYKKVYQIEFMFCKKIDVAKRIFEILEER